MKPLTEKQKDWAYRTLLHGPLRHVAEPAYRALLATELSWHRLTEGPRRRPSQPGLRDVTALIKTFERPARCCELVSSIQRLYPELPIIVVDDSRTPVTVPGANTFILPYDSGVATGRSEGLQRVTTKYVLNLDDDFVFFKHSNVETALACMNAFPEIDVMGGRVIDLPLYVTHPSRSEAIFKSAATPIREAGQRIGGLEVHDKVSNFFLARTDQVRKIDWDRALKRLDHADFFTRAKGRLLSVYNPSFQILHVKNPFDDAYRAMRFSIEEDRAYLAEKYASPWPPAKEAE